MANAEHIDTDNQASSKELEDSLFDNLEQDVRFQNGVSATSQGDDLDFINMTGLTPVGTEDRIGEFNSTTNDNSMNPEAPISFFEKGVGDVDSGMDPDNTGHTLMEDEELVPSDSQLSGEESKTVVGLKEIIADLSGELSTDVAELEDADSNAEPDDIPQVDLDTITEINLEAASAALEDLGKSTLIEDSISTETPPPELSAAAYNFQEAGELIRTLEDGETDVEVDHETFAPDSLDLDTMSEDEPTHDSERVIITSVGTSSTEQDTSVYNRPLKQGASLRKRKQHNMAGKLTQWGIRFVFLIAIAGAGYYMWQLYENRSLSPQELYTQAGLQIEENDFGAASDIYADLVRRFPDNPLRADAEYMAGYALYLIPGVEAKSIESHNKAIAIFEQFLVENPSHHKAARAETLLGFLYYRTGHYTDAISRLGDPNRRLRDPGAYLPTLRALARSYAAEGQIEKARSAFLQAAVLESNVEPDKDYLELANLYMTLAERDSNPAMSRRYSSLAIEQWDHATRIPGILSSQRKEIEAARDVLQSKLTLEQDMIAGIETELQYTDHEGVDR